MKTLKTLKIMITMILLFSSLLTTSPLYPQAPISQKNHENQENQELTETSTLKDYLVYAALHNPALEAAFNNWKAALERVPQIKALPDPNFTFAYFIREVETRVGPQQAKIGLMQMFPWFGKLKLKGEAATETGKAEEQMVQKMKLELFYTVKNSYYQYYYLSQSVAVLKENVQLLQFLEAVLRSRYRTADLPYSDLIKIQVELDILQDRLTSIEESLIPVQAKLNAALNRPTRTPLAPQKPIEDHTPQLEFAPLAELLKTHNPQLKAIDHMVLGQQAMVQLAQKNYYPDFSIGVDYILTGSARMPGVTDSSKDPLVAMMSISLPIQFKRIKASVNEARYRLDSTKKLRQANENNLLSGLETVYFQYQNSGRKLTLYKDALIPRAKQGLEVTHTAFETGKVDFLNLIDSQRTLLNFQLAYQEALAIRHQRLAELEMIVGQELTH